MYNEFLFGACYYPEQWDKQDMKHDVRDMNKAGLNVVRMGEFAWSLYEPEDGKYNFDFLTETVEECAKYNMKVILGTPTAAPPIWLTEKYRDVLATAYNGQVMEHGSRQHHNHTSENYLKYCERITRKMAEIFAGYDNVIGWQIDNEINCHRSESYSNSDLTAFRKWVKDKYKSIESLNKSWGTTFWSLTFNSFEQVTFPRPTPTWRNPAWMLDYKRFISDTVVNYAKVQHDVLRKVTPDKFITHNGIFGHIDYNKLTNECLDFLSYDAYPSFHESKGIGEGRNLSAKLAKIRGCSEKFYILEQQSGPGGQVEYLLPTPEPGQIRLWTYQSLAAGASGILYFRWRTLNYGAEQLWHGILDYDGRENSRLKEVKQIAGEMQKAGEIFSKARVNNDVAIYTNYDNEINFEVNSYLKSDTNRIYNGLSKLHIGCDIISDTGIFDRYRTIFFPHIEIADEILAQALEQFVKKGGTAIIGARSGQKDLNGNYYRQPMPGVFIGLAGVTVDWFSTLPKEYEQNIQCGGLTLPPSQFIEMLTPVSAQIIGTYTSRHLKGKGSISINTVDNGKVIYFGSFFTEENIKLIVPYIKERQHPFKLIPESVEISRLNYQNNDYYLLLNYKDTEQTLDLGEEYRDILTDEVIGKKIEAYGVLFFN